LLRVKDYRTCVQTGLREARRTPDTALGTDFQGYAFACAENLPQGDAETARIREVGIARLREILAKPDAPLAADDRSDALATLAEVLDVSGKHAEAVAAMQKRAQVLDKAAAAARTRPWRPPSTRIAWTPGFISSSRAKRSSSSCSARRRCRTTTTRRRGSPGCCSRRRGWPKRMRPSTGPWRKWIAASGASPSSGLKAKILQAEGKSTAAVLREQLDVLRSLPKTQRRPEQEAEIERKLGTASR